MEKIIILLAVLLLIFVLYFVLRKKAKRKLKRIVIRTRRITDVEKCILPSGVFSTTRYLLIQARLSDSPNESSRFLRLARSSKVKFSDIKSDFDQEITDLGFDLNKLSIIVIDEGYITGEEKLLILRASRGEFANANHKSATAHFLEENSPSRRVVNQT